MLLACSKINSCELATLTKFPMKLNKLRKNELSVSIVCTKEEEDDEVEDDDDDENFLKKSFTGGNKFLSFIINVI